MTIPAKMTLTLHSFGGPAYSPSRPACYHQHAREKKREEEANHSPMKKASSLTRTAPPAEGGNRRQRPPENTIPCRGDVYYDVRKSPSQPPHCAMPKKLSTRGKPVPAAERRLWRRRRIRHRLRGIYMPSTAPSSAAVMEGCHIYGGGGFGGSPAHAYQLRRRRQKAAAIPAFYISLAGTASMALPALTRTREGRSQLRPLRAV